MISAVGSVRPFARNLALARMILCDPHIEKATAYNTHKHVIIVINYDCYLHALQCCRHGAERQRRIPLTLVKVGDAFRVAPIVTHFGLRDVGRVSVAGARVGHGSAQGGSPSW
jgi:hypothetical protein